jgi:hypothetical protein
MDEIDYLSGELTDQVLHAQADTGDRILDAEAFEYRLTQQEIEKLVRSGEILIFIDWLQSKIRNGARLTDSPTVRKANRAV